MASLTSKSHKSRKTAAEQTHAGKPRKTTSLLDGEPPPLPVPAIAEPPATSSLTTILTSPEPSEKQDEASADTGVIDETPAKQWWFRKPDSPQRKLAEKVAIMTKAGRDDKFIAKKLGTKPSYIQNLRYIARKNGWYDAEDEPIDYEFELALSTDRKLIRNTNAILDGQMTNWQTFELTKEGMKGRGFFRNHTVQEGGQQGPAIVAIKVVMPPIGEADQQQAIPGDDFWGGQPAYLDGEVTDGDLRPALPAAPDSVESDGD